MKIPLLVVACLVLPVTVPDILACGEKFLVSSRGTRFQRAAVAREPAAILVYVNPSSTLPKALERVRLEATLLRVGYQPTLVSAPAEFEAALRKGGWDLIVADLADSVVLVARLQDDGPAILPVVYGATGSVVADARRQFRHVLRGPVKSGTFLDAVDDVLAARRKVRTKSV